MTTAAAGARPPSPVLCLWVHKPPPCSKLPSILALTPLPLPSRPAPQVGKETGGKKLEGPHALKANEMAQVVFEPCQPLVVDHFKACEGLSRIAFLDGNTAVMLGKVGAAARGRGRGEGGRGLQFGMLGAFRQRPRCLLHRP